jgi:uncharacterized OB-fold protein
LEMNDQNQTRPSEQADESAGKAGKRPTGQGRECPECGEPMDDVRKTCMNCGHEFADDDYENPEAGTEFRAGAAVTDEGEEISDWDPEGDAAD